jgi:hypothetical protein
MWQTLAANGSVSAHVHVTSQTSGGTFSAYVSADGVNWTLIAGSTATLNITGSMLGGLAVTSHKSGALWTMDTVVTG